MLAYQLSIATTGGLLTDPDTAQRFDREITATLAELGALGQERVVHHAPHGVSSGGGGLRGSVFTEAYGMPARRGQLISSSVYYAPPVEMGRRPGKRPPFAGGYGGVSPLTLWVARKLGKTGAEGQHVAFLIGRKIGRAGTVGAKMFQKSANELRPLVQSRFQALTNRIAEILK